jgi:hypothetical protein
MSADPSVSNPHFPVIVKAAAQESLAHTHQALTTARAALNRVPAARRHEAEYRRLEAELDELELSHREVTAAVAACPATLVDLTAVLTAGKPPSRRG